MTSFDIVPQKIRESNERFFKICKISTTCLMSLIEDILDLAKIEAGTFTLNEQPFLIKNLAQDIEFIFAFQWIHKGLKFIVDVDNDIINSSFYSDIGRIKQIIMNLISNAFKFTPAGGITFSIRCLNKFDESNFERWNYLEFKVADTGIGIPDNEIHGLFKMFGTIDQNSKEYNWRGTGIGLTISKKLVESLGGTIHLCSVVGSGTIVSFTVKEKQTKVSNVKTILNYDDSEFEDSFDSSDQPQSSGRKSEIESVPIFKSHIFNLS